MQIHSHVQVGETHDGPNSVRAAIENALLHRLNPATVLTDRGREFRGRRAMDLIRACEESRGGSVRGRSDMEVLTRAYGMHTTSDFPAILEAVLNTRLREQMQVAEGGSAAIVTTGTANDFNPQKEVDFSAFPEMQKVNEAGEIKFGTLTEGSEQTTIASYGAGINVSFQLLINDNLNAIERAVMSHVPANVSLKSGLIIQALNSIALADGHPLFHSAHNNLSGSPAEISVASIGAGRLAMRQQKLIGSSQPTGIGPAILLVPAELETKAEQFLAAITPTAAAEANPFAGKLRLAVEPRLTDPLAWYLFADPTQLPCIRFLTLDGYEVPKLETSQQFTTIGTSYRLTWHCGAGPVDWRGAYKNPGAEPA